MQEEHTESISACLSLKKVGHGDKEDFSGILWFNVWIYLGTITLFFFLSCSLECLPYHWPVPTLTFGSR
jgi:hypothetical protein